MRPKSINRDLPPRMLRRTRTLKSGKVWESFYYNGRTDDGKRVEIPLGNDLNEAKKRWAQLEVKDIPADASLMRFVFNRYEREIIPGKAPKTQSDNLGSLKMLRAVFDSAPIEAITPQFVAQYRDKRSAKAKVRANREIALLSHIWNLAREWGYTAKENPTKGVRKNREKPRDFYADDEIWRAVYTKAVPELADAMDLAYLTGQRPADVLKMRLSDIRDDDVLEVSQGKTSKKLRIKLNTIVENKTVRNELGRAIDRIRARDRKVRSMYLVATAAGFPINRWTLRVRFDKARTEAVKEAREQGKDALAERIAQFQFRDARAKAASEMDLVHASKLLGHTEQEITDTVYRRIGETVLPTK